VYGALRARVQLERAERPKRNQRGATDGPEQKKKGSAAPKDRRAQLA
jgi:hypothetical protein